MKPLGGWAAVGVVGVFALRGTMGLGRLSPGIEMTFGQCDAALRKNGFCRQLHAGEKKLTVTPTTTPGCGLLLLISRLKS